MQSRQQPRGFAILVIMAVIAAASLIIGGQLTAAASQEGTQIRSQETSKARGLADRCVELADAYVQAYLTANSSSDLDRVLDPDGTIHNDDDFVPPSTLISGGTLVQVPPGVSSTANANKNYNYMRYAIGGGSCLLRFDDNSDDSSANAVASFTSNNTVAEGPTVAGAEVPWRDRDRAIIITAIGLYPASASAATDYTRAHARATVRRIVGNPVNPSSGAAIQAGGNVTLDGKICGSQAGVIADKIIGTACVCGQVDAELSGGATTGPCGSCTPCASSAGSTTAVGNRAPPVVNVATFSSMLDNTGFGNPYSSGNNIAAAGYGRAVIYLRDAEATNPTTGTTYIASKYQLAGSTDVFVWDPDDTDAEATIETGSGPAVTNAGGVLNSCTDTSARDPIPRPCKWANAAAAIAGAPTSTGVVQCSVGETPCWKLVARVGTHAGNTHAADFDTRTTFARAEVSTNVAADVFAPGSDNLPFFKNNKKFSDLATGSCGSCNSTVAYVTEAANVYTFPAVSTADAPAAVVVLDTVNTTKTTIAGTKDSRKLSLLTTTQVDVTGGQCCSNCSCGVACSSSTTGISKATHGPGFAVRTNNICPVGGSGIFGTLQCKNFDAGNSTCLVGGVIATEASPGSINCGFKSVAVADAYCDSATGSSICFKNNPDLVGDLIATGAICFKNNFGGTGSIQSETFVGGKNNTAFSGQILSEGDIGFKNNQDITFNGSGGSTFNGLNARLWMESSW